MSNRKVRWRRDRDEDNKPALVSKSGFLAQHSGLVAVIH
jgi:hypothetical protein